MNLAFSQKFPKGKGRISAKTTFFCEKIWSSIYIKHLSDDLMSNYVYKSILQNGKSFHNAPFDIQPKHHTIRKDTNNRWESGNDIHFIINPRSPQRFQFAPVIPCISTQNIEIQHRLDEIIVRIDGKKYGRARLNQLGEIFNYNIDLNILAINDGFDSVQDFFLYFNTDFKGKIIHWTDIKY